MAYSKRRGGNSRRGGSSRRRSKPVIIRTSRGGTRM